MLDLANRLDQIGLEINIIDMGGGLGVRYIDEETSTPAELMEIYQDVFSGTNKRIFLEPGRSIAANAGILLANRIPAFAAIDLPGSRNILLLVPEKTS